MVFLPLPIVAALVLATMLLILRERLLSAPAGRVFGILLLLYCVESVLIGIRWGYDIMYLLPLQSWIAALWCPLAWIAFRSLSHGKPSWQWPDDWPHLLPVSAVTLCILFGPSPIEVILMLTYLVYGVMLARLARRGPDALGMVRLSSAVLSHRALVVTALLMFFFVLVDLLISIDIHGYQGQHASTVVAIATVPMLLLLGVAAAVAGQERVEAKEDEELEPRPEVNEEAVDVEAQQLMPQLQTLVQQLGLYKDPELNLQCLARKCGVPARRVSRAINLVTGQNVSQWVNEQRITAACELLKSSDGSVTSIMEAVGFMTKSNFNREFKRVTGTTPSAWRSASDSG
ncbi:helix-turn-helix domain-containing protein [Marinobacterium jannaschii]|uniref:helix-turn-helix domain-containing protein n=1 Tax=Marinobacterium jannaschii TaxID=64970 RepID=UPI00055BA993|nr:AraC family transcriptional regulator [Marinobacterium jannaschii]